MCSNRFRKLNKKRTRRDGRSDASRSRIEGCRPHHMMLTSQSSHGRGKVALDANVVSAISYSFRKASNAGASGESC